MKKGALPERSGTPLQRFTDRHPSLLALTTLPADLTVRRDRPTHGLALPMETGRGCD